MKYPSILLFKAVLWMGLSVLSCSHSAWAQATNPRILMLGEVHDNAAGHALRLVWLQRHVSTTPKPVLVMEQFDREHQSLLDEAMAQCKQADCVIERAGKNAWDWPLYKPLLQWALEQGLTVKAGNVSAADANRAIKRGAQAVLPAEVWTSLGVQAEVLPPDYVAAQTEAIVRGHCNMLPGNVAEKMIQAQWARDLWMAHLMQQVWQQGGTAVLIAGNGHVDKALGAPRWLSASAQADLLVRAYVEHIEPDATRRYDHVDQVPAQQRPDPCEAFKAHMRGKP